MKYTINEIASEIGFNEAWIRYHEKIGNIKLKSHKTKGQAQRRMFDDDDKKTIIEFARSRLDGKKLRAKWRLLNRYDEPYEPPPWDRR